MHTFMEGLMAAPLWVQLWVLWLVVINSASLGFLKHREGRVVLIVWMINGASMMTLAATMGYNRLLGLPHILWWTPLIIYLMRARKQLEPPSAYTRWLTLLMASIGLSLLIDYIDVLRYILGDRS